MKILMFTSHIRQISGATVVMHELATELQSMGHRVEVCAATIGAPMADAFDTAQVPLHDLSSVPDLGDFDLVFSHHHVLPAVMSLRPETVALPRIISISLSPFSPLEMPGAIVDLAESVVANSPETAEQLIEFGIPSDAIFVFENACPRSFDQSRPRQRHLSRLLAVSNHLPPELDQAFKLLADEGISVTHVGLPKEQTRVTPEMIQDHDAVVTIGKTVQYAICGQTPVYIYDHFGGPGWLRTENFDLALYHNFSGRCCARKLDAEALKQELLSGYDDAAGQAEILKQHSGHRFDLRRKLDDLLSSNRQKTSHGRDAVNRVRREGILARKLPDYLEGEITIRRQQALLSHKDADIARRATRIKELSVEAFNLRNRLAKLQPGAQETDDKS